MRALRPAQVASPLNPHEWLRPLDPRSGGFPRQSSLWAMPVRRRGWFFGKPRFVWWHEKA